MAVILGSVRAFVIRWWTPIYRACPSEFVQARKLHNFGRAWLTVGRITPSQEVARQRTGVSALDTTIQKTNIWLKEVMDELESDDRHRAYLALRSVLHSLRDRLTVEEATDLGAQLPILVRGFYYDAWNPSGKQQPVSTNPAQLWR